jgi:hypothetical protein
MAQFMITIFGDESAEARATEAETAAVIDAYNAYSKAMEDAGVIRGGHRLRPSGEARRVRVRDKKRTVVDGPFTETKEVLGGYYLIECATRDEALEWAARCPGAEHAFVEVWPVWE